MGGIRSIALWIALELMILQRIKLDCTVGGPLLRHVLEGPLLGRRIDPLVREASP